jgi:DNA primase
MMRIPDTKIDDVRNSSDIVDVISVHVPLKKRGKNYVGRCPFHQEKTPSFSVSPDKQMFYCFGCGKGGNVFTFVMEHDKVSFLEAVRTLADRAGIALPEEGAEDREQATENEGLYSACRVTAAHFVENLLRTVEGKLALEYFRHRGFSDDTIRRFGLGYAMNGWDDVAKFAEREKIDAGVMEKAGLILRRDDGSGYYDRFRGRAMFPIFSPTGRIIAFGARKMREDDPLGKYINSPETPIYNKSRHLYGLFQAREALRAKEYAILVEGYADLISVYQAGIENIVASSGTALTEEQIQLIGRYTKTITLVYDADSAGSKATMRGVDLVIENGLDVKVAELSAGDDPDSFVRKHGRDAFQKLLDGAVSFLDFKAGFFQAQGLLSTPEGKTRAVRSIVETIAKIKDELKRTFFVKTLAEKYDIYESVIFRELEKILGQQSTRARYEERREHEGSSAPDGAPAPKTDTAAPLPPAERDLLKVILEHGDPLISFIFSHIAPDTFGHPLARQLVDLVLARQGTEWDVTGLVNAIEDPALKNFVAHILFSRFEISKGWAAMGSQPDEPDPWRIAEDSILAMKVLEIDRKIEESYRKLKSAEARGEPLAVYQQEVMLFQKEKKNLKSSRLIKEE